MVEKLALGTAQLGEAYGINNRIGALSPAQAQALLEQAWSVGIRWLDTAPAYGGALAHIGEFHRRNGTVFQVISKYSRSYAGGRSIRDDVERQLEELAIPKLAVLELHRMNELGTSPRLLEEAAMLKDEGLLGKVGVSVYENDELAAALRIPHVEVIQLPFNVLDNMSRRGALIHAASNSGKELHARSVYLQGLLLRPAELFPEPLRPLLACIREISGIAARFNRSLQELMLLYVFQNECFQRIILGIEAPPQLAENIRLLCAAPLSQDCIRAIDAVVVKEEALLNPSNWSSKGKPL